MIKAKVVDSPHLKMLLKLFRKIANRNHLKNLNQSQLASRISLYKDKTGL